MQNNLIRLRKQAGLSQEDLADKLAVSRQAVSKWERGEALPDTDNLIRLAKLYNVSIDEIVGYTPEKGQAEQADDFADGNSASGGFTSGGGESGNGGEFANGGKDGENESDATNGKSAADKEAAASDFDDDGNDGKDGDGKDGENGYGEEFFTQKGKRGKFTFERNGRKKSVTFTDDGGEQHIFFNDDDKDDDDDDEDDDVDNDDYPRKRVRLSDVIDGIYVLLAIAAFFVWGAVFDGWGIAWTLFITIPIFTSIVRCIRKKRVKPFNFPCFVTFIYLLFGLIFGIWHPLWVIFLLIPVFYPLARVIDSCIKYGKKGKNKR